MGTMMRCRRCAYLDWDFSDGSVSPPLDGSHYCGLHGGTKVDIDGEQVNLDHKGGCGFCARQVEKAEQLAFPWW